MRSSYFTQYNRVGDLEIVTGFSGASVETYNVDTIDIMSGAALRLFSSGLAVWVELDFNESVIASGALWHDRSMDFNQPVNVQMDVTTQEVELCATIVKPSVRRWASMYQQYMGDVAISCFNPSTETWQDIVKYSPDTDHQLIEIGNSYAGDMNDDNHVDWISPFSIIYSADLYFQNGSTLTGNLINGSFNLAFADYGQSPFQYIGVGDINNDNALDLIGTGSPGTYQYYTIVEAGGDAVGGDNCTENVQTVKYYTGSPTCVNESIIYRSVTNRCTRYYLTVDCYGDGEQIQASELGYDPYITCVMNKTGVYQAKIYVSKSPIIIGASYYGLPFASVNTGTVTNGVPPSCYLTNDYSLDLSNNLTNLNIVDDGGAIVEGEMSTGIKSIFLALGFNSEKDSIYLGFMIIIFCMAAAFMWTNNVAITIISGLICYIALSIADIFPMRYLVMICLTGIVLFFVFKLIGGKSDGGGV
jgi:hypothetical protein